MIVIGIAGALLLRAIAIAAGVTLIESVEAVVYVFGALLLYVAYRAFRGAAEQSDPSANPVLRLVRAPSRSTDGSAAAGCSSAKQAVATAHHCCSWSSRSSSPTLPSRSIRFPPLSRSPATRS